MIKGISFIRPTANRASFERLAGFFSALGLEAGRGWEEGDSGGEAELTDTSQASRGASFLAPVGNLEFVDGRMPEFAPIAIEVTSLDAMHQAAEAWLRREGADRAATISEIGDTHWKARYFTVEVEPGQAFSFWAWTDPVKGKSVAVEGDLSAEGMRFGIVVSLDALLRSGARRADIEIVRVPGAWEIPAAARTLANRAMGGTVNGAAALDAVVTLGCLLRGETAHYEAIYSEVARGIGQSQQETGIPHSFGVLTCETLEQALNRAGIKAGNKGFEAAAAAIEMVSLRRKLLAGANA